MCFFASKHFRNENYLYSICNDIADIIQNTVDCDISYGFIGYRERNEIDPIVFHQISEDLESVKRAIRESNPRGGGDDAEDVENALQYFTNNIEFSRDATRIIIHIADFPCHGYDYHDASISDNHQDWSDRIPNLLSRVVNNFTCAYWFVKLTSHTDKMIEKFSSIIHEKSNGRSTLQVIDARNIDARDLLNQFKIILQNTILLESIRRAQTPNL